MPKVDSAFIELLPIKNPPAKINDQERFFRITRAAFNQRRKVLKNSLSGIIPAEDLQAFFKLKGIDPKARPETLEFTDFAQISNL